MTMHSTANLFNFEARPTPQAINSAVKADIRALAEKHRTPGDLGTSRSEHSLKVGVAMSLLADVMDGDAMDLIRAAATLSEAMAWGRDATTDDLEGAYDDFIKTAAKLELAA